MIPAHNLVKIGTLASLTGTEPKTDETGSGSLTAPIVDGGLLLYDDCGRVVEIDIRA